VGRGWASNKKRNVPETIKKTLLREFCPKNSAAAVGRNARILEGLGQVWGPATSRQRLPILGATATIGDYFVATGQFSGMLFMLAAESPQAVMTGGKVPGAHVMHDLFCFRRRVCVGPGLLGKVMRCSRKQTLSDISVSTQTGRGRGRRLV